MVNAELIPSGIKVEIPDISIPSIEDMSHEISENFHGVETRIGWSRDHSHFGQGRGILEVVSRDGTDIQSITAAILEKIQETLWMYDFYNVVSSNSESSL